MEKQTDEFYIGWQEAAPDGISRRVRMFIVAVCVIVPIIGALLALNQRGFVSSNFEFGETTELEGALITTPAPFLEIYRGNDVNDKLIFQHILLVKPGKHGMGEEISDLEKNLKHSLDGQFVKLQGSLIYHDGKTMMEVEKITSLMLDTTGIHVMLPFKPIGSGTFVGEIADPKCLFGVMKPGYGKPHRSCGARCIAGGIPPVLKTISDNGNLEYYLLVNEDGSPLNDQILPYVGDQVVVCGEVKMVGDWMVLYKFADKNLALAPETMRKELPLCK
ncbi:MAG: hypothetical protein GC192_04265 [Bacteroidetes bacterium]|nr:hypothetical protein [Bacteroidota bacterium]